MTPEGKVKARVDKILKAANCAYWHKAVLNGMGTPTLDYTGCSYGRYFAIETKAFGEVPTKRQQLTIAQMEAAGATVFVIIGADKDNTHLVGDIELCLFLHVQC